MTSRVRERFSTARANTDPDLTGTRSYTTSRHQQWLTCSRSLGTKEWQFPLDARWREFLVEIAPAGAQHLDYAGSASIPRQEAQARIGLCSISVLFHPAYPVWKQTDTLVTIPLHGCESISTGIDEIADRKNHERSLGRWNVLDYCTETGWCDHHKAYYLSGTGPVVDEHNACVICVSHQNEALRGRIYLELQSRRNVIGYGHPRFSG